VSANAAKLIPDISPTWEFRLPVENSNYPSGSLLASEIAQQPELWPTTLERVLAAGVPPEWLSGPCILTGAGTSAYAASAIAEAWTGALAVPTTDLLTQPAAAIEASYPHVRQGGLVISLARSGNSPESLAIVEKFQKHFPRGNHLAIVCSPDGRLAHIENAKVLLLDPRTNDRSLAMTASFSNLVLAGLALKHGEELAAHLPEICTRVMQALPKYNSLLEQIARSCNDRVVVLSTEMQALGKEVALKIIELTDGKVLAMPETYLGFRHGAVGFLREDTPVLCFLSSNPWKQLYERDLIEDLRGKNLGRFMIVGGDPALAAERDWFVPAMSDSLPDRFRTPFEVPLAQLLAYHLSVNAKVDPDNPSPKGTITRVVRPFRIHPEPEGPR
jgi:D-galactosamine 6-phosphate deaminase/isomerase